MVALARELGRDPSFITRVKNGDAMPSIEVAAQIQRITKGAVTALDYVHAAACSDVRDHSDDSAPIERGRGRNGPAPEVSSETPCPEPVGLTPRDAGRAA